MDGKFANAGGSRIFFVEKGAGESILYVHGNVASSRWFERAMDIPGFRTIALDMPNFGRSSPLAGEVDIDRYADAVAAFILELGLDRPLLVAHSLGGAVAISLAARRPDLIGDLVLVDSSSPSGLVTPESHYPAVEAMRTNPAVLAAGLKAVAPAMKDEAFFAKLVEDGSLLAAPAWAGNARALARFDYRGRCGAFCGKVLVLWGRKDSIITEEMARETAAAFTEARLEILEGIGHAVMVEDAPRFLALVSAFARECMKNRTKPAARRTSP